MKTTFLVLLLIPSFALAGSIQFEILPNPQGMSEVQSLNSAGGMSGPTGTHVRIVQQGSVVDVAPTSFNGVPVTRVRLADNGWLVGMAGTYSQFTPFSACTWSPSFGWRNTQAFVQAEGWGATGDGRVLVREGQSGFRAYWWNPVTGAITSLYNNQVLNQAEACNVSGQALINNIPGRFVQSDGSLLTLQYADTSSWANGISSNGLIAGSSGFEGSGQTQTTGVIWNAQGQVLHAIPFTFTQVGYAGLQTVNSSMTASGYRVVNNISRAIYWTATSGVVDIGDNLLPGFSDYRFESVIKIADNGVMLVEGYRPGSTQSENFLVRAVPEPASFTILGAGILGLLRRKRRQP